MRHLVIPSYGGSDVDHVLEAAAHVAGGEGTLVLIAVLPGSLVGASLGPEARGRLRRQEENRAKSALAAQIARIHPLAECHVIALFGDVVFDTLLLARNLGADAVWMTADDPDLTEMLADSPIPVVVVPPTSEARGEKRRQALGFNAGATSRDASSRTA